MGAFFPMYFNPPQTVHALFGLYSILSLQIIRRRISSGLAA